MSKETRAGLWGTTVATGDLKHRTVRGGVVTVTAQAVKFALQVGSTMILARLLSPADFGLIAMVAAVTGLAALFKDLGLSAAIIQRPQITSAEVSNLFWVNVAVSLALVAVTAALGPVLVWFYGESKLLAITLVLALSYLPGGLVVQPQALLRRQMRFGVLAGVELSAQLAGVAAGVAAAWWGAGYWALLIMQLTVGVWYLVGAWFACGWWPAWPVAQTNIRPLLAFGGYLTGANLLAFVNTHLDQILIGRFFGSHAVGNYSRAFALLLLPLQQLAGPLTTVTIPSLSRLATEPVRYRRAFLRMFELICLVSLPVVAIMMATADWLILVALGPQWTAATRIFAVLGLLAFAQVFSNAALWIFITQGQTKRLWQWSVGNTALVLLGLAAGLPWGVMGVASTYALSGILIRTPLFLWAAGRAGPVTTGDFYRVGGPYFLLAVAVGAALRAIRWWWTGPEHPLAGLALFGALGAGLYLLLLASLPSGREALRSVRDVIRMVRGTTPTEPPHDND